MFEIHDLWLFVLSGLLLNISPGPDTLYIVGRSSTQGARAAAAAYLTPPVGMRGIFLQGFFTNVLNPKVALFFLAFLPQFVSPDSPAKPLALLALGVIFDLNGTLWNLFLAWSAARIGGRLTASRRLKAWFNRCVGAVFVGIGVRLALSHDR
jgi:threonine/homoserine/homoserine lactone efflux protein